MYVDPTTRHTFNYATPIECANNPQDIIELDPDTDDGEFYVLTPDPLKREAPQMFRPTQIKTTITPNIFTAQDAGFYSNAELEIISGIEYYLQNTQIRLSNYLENHDDGESIYDFLTMHNEQHSHTGSNPYNHLRIGLHDHLLNLLPLFNPNWFIQAFINLFGYPCYILTQCGIYFSTFLFMREVLTFLLRFYRTIGIKKSPKQHLHFEFNSPWIFKIVKSEMVTDLNIAGKRKQIWTKHKLTTSENDHILLSEKETHKKMRRYSDNDSPYLPPIYK